MKKLTTALVLGGALLSGAAQADTVFGVYAGAGKWQSELTGDIGLTATDFSTLGFDEESNNTFYLAIEHPLPVLPNLMLKRTDLSTAGMADPSNAVTFRNLSFPAGETLATDFDLSATDATLYYEVLDNWLNLDLGLTLRSFSGELTAMGLTETESIELDTVLPLGYVKGQIDLPLTGFSLKADANAIAYGGDSISDLSAAVAYNSSFLVAFELGVELGYRRLNLALDELGDLQTDLTIDGPYLSVNAHF